MVVLPGFNAWSLIEVQAALSPKLSAVLSCLTSAFASLVQAPPSFSQKYLSRVPLGPMVTLNAPDPETEAVVIFLRLRGGIGPKARLARVRRNCRSQGRGLELDVIPRGQVSLLPGDQQ